MFATGLILNFEGGDGIFVLGNRQKRRSNTYGFLNVSRFNLIEVKNEEMSLLLNKS